MRRTTALRAALVTGSGAFVALTAWWGRQLNETNPRMVGGGSPWYGTWDVPTIDVGQWHRVVPAVVVAAALLAWWPKVCRRVALAWLPWLSGLVGVGWAVVVQSIAGWSSLSYGVSYLADYLEAVPLVGSPARFLSTFIERADGYPIHVQGHPPGQVLLLWALDGIGFGGPWPATVQTLLFAALATVGVLTVTRWEAGEHAVRRAAVFVSLTPAVLTVATSTDPTFSALAVAAVVLGFAAERTASTRATALGVSAGVAAAVACQFSYAAPLFLLPAVIPLYRMVRTRRLAPVLAAVLGAGMVLGLVAAAGFWWWEGLQHTRAAYGSGIARHRPYVFFLFANLAVALVAVGPAVVAAAARRPPRGSTPLVLCALGALAFADLVGLSKGEVERIWLPFFPWIALWAAALPDRVASDRGWLGAQLAVALGLQLTFMSPW